MANLVPNTLRKDGKNPLLHTGQLKSGRTSSLDQASVQLTRENAELNNKVLFLEDKVRKLRRIRVLYTERDRQVKELQGKLTTLLQDIEELRETHPHLEGGLSAFLQALDAEEGDGGAPAQPVHIDEYYRLHHLHKAWRDPWPAVSAQMDTLKTRFRALTETNKAGLN